MGRWTGVEVQGWTGERVKRLRAALGLSRAKLGERIGIHQFSIGRWERGSTLPSSEACLRLSRLLLEELTKQRQPGDDGGDLGEDLPYDEDGSGELGEDLDDDDDDEGDEP